MPVAVSPDMDTFLRTANDAAARAALDTPATNAAAGGVLAGTYPNPSFAVDMATQAELDAVAAAKLSNGATPIVVAFKNVTVLTSGAPADVASITLPSWCTRWRLSPTAHLCIAESASGTLAGASLTVRDAASGGGSAVTASFFGPASTSVVVLPAATLLSILPTTANTIYLHQTANSANAGTVSVYLTLVPLL